MVSVISIGVLEMLPGKLAQTGPEAASTLAGLKHALRSGLVRPDERVVLVNTGSGLKSVPSLYEAEFPVIRDSGDVSVAQ